MSAEVGRQPWVVHPRVERDAAGNFALDSRGLLKYRLEEGLLTNNAVSEAVDAGQVLGSIIMFGIIYALLLAVWVLVLNHKIHKGAPWAAAVVVLNVLAVANIPRAVFADKPGQAFLSSSVAIIAMVTLFSIALWPNLVTASNNPQFGLSIYRAASSNRTLGIMFIIACIGIPLVLTYTTIVYWTFRNRVEIGPHSY